MMRIKKTEGKRDGRNRGRVREREREELNREGKKRCGLSFFFFVRESDKFPECV